MELEKKHKKLKNMLAGYGKVAVAFSGGVDSSLLLSVCCDVLGFENVIGVQAVSCLLSSDTVYDARMTFKRCTGEHLELTCIELFPLEWDEFVKNGEERCYLCKKKVYSILKKFGRREGCDYLLDGTNVDDFEEQRPGLKAIRELDVQTPLLAAGLNKTEVRGLARMLGLTNHDLPSNSCLATRIPHHTEITLELLKDIEKAESILKKMGFFGCRVRPLEKQAVIEIMKNDFSRVVEQHYRDEITRQFKSLGFETIRLDLIGRSS